MALVTASRYSLAVVAISHIVSRLPEDIADVAESMCLSRGPDLATCIFLLAFTVRYVRTFVGMYAWMTYEPVPVSMRPIYTSRDATVVVPTTFKDPGELIECLKCVSACSPKDILVVTANSSIKLVEHWIFANGITDVAVLGVSRLNKRDQMIRALREVHTELVVFADDDVFWPEDYLDSLLAVFEHSAVGAGGTRQRVRRNSSPGLWNILGINYLERRAWNNICTNAIDGSISTLSGRTAAYRTKILKSEEFFEYFTTDSWLGRKLNSDDDKCLTRYVYSHGWKIKIQSDPRSVLYTTLEGDSKYLNQCMRWARAHWRGNFTVMTKESYWRSPTYWWGFLAIYLGQFQTPALLVDGILAYLLSLAVASTSAQCRLGCYITFCGWVVFTKAVKMIRHFCQHPRDIAFLPGLILFSYLHGAINIYALCTMHNTLWGSQSLQELEKSILAEAVTTPITDRQIMQTPDVNSSSRMMNGNDSISATPKAPSADDAT